MKKNFLFAMLAIFLAGAGFGGISMADSVDCSNVTTQDGLSTCIGQGGKVTILEGDYTLDQQAFTKDITIKGGVDGVVIKGPAKCTDSNSNHISDGNVKAGTLNNNVTVTFENVTLDLGDGNCAGQGFAGNTANSTVIIKDSTVKGRLTTFTKMELNNVIFNTTPSYNVDVHNGSQVDFVGCTFEGPNRNINVYDWNNDGGAEHNVTFDNCTFKSGAVKKGAIVIHESHTKQSYTVKYKINVNNSSLEDPTKYPNNVEKIWRGNETTKKEGGYYSMIVAKDGLIMIDDIRRVINAGEGDIEVTVDDEVVYKTPATTVVNGIGIDELSELQAVVDWYRSEGYCIGEWNGNDLVPDGAGATEIIITEATDETAEAKIGDKKYCKLDDAIEFAENDDVIEVLKANTYTLPSEISKAVTIKKSENLGENDKVIITESDNNLLSDIKANVTFEGITFNLPTVNKHFGQDNSTTITMKDCEINGVLLARGNMTFDGCKFNNTIAGNYNLNISFGNINIKDSIFTNVANRNVNIVRGTKDGYTVNFENTTFSNNDDNIKKAAVMVHELYKCTGQAECSDTRTDNSKITINGSTYIAGKWTVNFDSKTKIAENSKAYSDKYIGNNQLWGIDTLYASKNEAYVEHFDSNDELDPSKVSADVLSSVILGSENGGEVTVTVNGTKVYSTPKKDAEYTVSFDGVDSADKVKDGAKVVEPAAPTKSCNRFEGWYLGNDKYDFNTAVTSDIVTDNKLALVSKWTYTCSSSSGGGGSSKKSETTKTDDAKATTGDTATVDDKNAEDKNDETKADETKTSEEAKAAADAQALKDGYSQEFIDAYNFAYKNGITTMPTINEAQMDQPLTRIAMAKMLSQYAINVLGKTPDTTIEVPNFPDVSEELDAQYNNGVTLAYQLGIMGINVEKFRPNDLVTRAEFGTALSRMLYGLADGEGNEWYKTHLDKLMEEKIITVDTPNLKELRGYVMIMLMRSANRNSQS